MQRRCHKGEMVKGGFIGLVKVGDGFGEAWKVLVK